VPVYPALDQEINPIPPVEELPIVPVYDEGSVDYVLWIVFTSTTRYDITLKEWSFTNGFSGTEIVLPENPYAPTAVLIFDGWVWGVDLFAGGDYSDSIFRKNIETGETQTLHNHISQSPEGARAAASTVTPLGVLFAIGRVSASYILINDAGEVVYKVPNNTSYLGGWLGDALSSFVNDGTHAYLHYTDTSGGLRGMAIIDIATGASTTVSMSAQYFDTPDDYRNERGSFATISGGQLYELASVSINEDDYYLEGAQQIRIRNPATSITSAMLVDITAFVEGYPDYSYGVAGQVDAGLLLFATSRNITTIDPATNAVLSSVGYYRDLIGRGTSIIPGANFVLIHYGLGNVQPAGLVAHDPSTGASTEYSDGFVGSVGYLTQITTNAASNPAPTLPPQKEEWEYLSATNVNPI
jgi:hypothetical protein